ncbi:MAG: ribonuclease P protein component [Prevotella sp.]|nr:ribonuclease P protein component [Prevotella sp.]MDY5685948.1 ribonuclease P protein component [Prevotella sp.]
MPTHAPHKHTLGKQERLCSRKLIDSLFKGGGSRAMSGFPLRMVYAMTERHEGEPAAQILVSVPKRCFKRAVKRNRIKRLVREAYRLNKHILADALERHEPQMSATMAFIYTDSHLHDYATVEQRVRNLLTRLSERL